MRWRSLAPLLLAACRREPAVDEVSVPIGHAMPTPAAAAAAPPGDPHGFEGRPIAPTMSYLGADWLTRPERIAEEDPDRLHRLLAVRPGQTACDLGAGSGYHSLRLAAAVGPRGRVIASDLQPQMLELLRAAVREAGVSNVEAVLATDDDPQLPTARCDLILLVDVYHELADPARVLERLRDALAPGGRLALVEFHGEDPEIPIKPEHKMTRAQVLRELEPRGFRLVQTSEALPWQHLLVFERADEPAD